MALTYDKVIGVISQPPVNRKDFEVNNILGWFRKKSDLFRTLKTELLVDLVKNLRFVTKKRDEIIIREGDMGDCMYILLRGQVTIYIQYAKPATTENPEDAGSKPTPVEVATDGENIRQQLGTFVTNLGPGATFGEVALLKEDDCLRTASIIVSDNSVDLIEIDRGLYTRSVKKVLQQEFEDKSNFIAMNPFFKNWAPKYKKQLAMALEKCDFAYDSILTKQGDPVSAIYFILRGEVKVVMDPVLHKQQYPKYLDVPEESIHSTLTLEPGVHHENKHETRSSQLKHNDIRERSYSDGAKFQRSRRTAKRQPPLEVCLLGVNECVGDVETLLEMDTYMQTAVCTQRTEVLVLEMKHYERLLTKRNPKTVKMMKECLDLQLHSRMRHSNVLPLLHLLFKEVTEYQIQLHEKSQAKENHNRGHHTDRLKHRHTIAEYFDSFIPKPGPLIDMYGPGTVFHHIREREKQKRQRRVTNNGHNSHQEDHESSPQNSPRLGSGAEYYDPLTSDPALKALEERMRRWLEWDGGRQSSRISKLHRSTVEEESLKPGAKVVFRSRDIHVTTGDHEGDDEEEEKDYVHHGSSFNSTYSSLRSKFLSTSSRS